MLAKHTISWIILCFVLGCTKREDTVEVVAGAFSTPEAAVRRLATAASKGDLTMYLEVLDAESREKFSKMVADSTQRRRAERDAELEFEKALDEAFGIDSKDLYRSYQLSSKREDLLRSWRETLPMSAAKVEILSREEESAVCVKLELRFWGRFYDDTTLHQVGVKSGHALRENGLWKLRVPWLVQQDPQAHAKTTEFHLERLALLQRFTDDVKAQRFSDRREARDALGAAQMELSDREFPELKRVQPKHQEDRPPTGSRANDK